MKKIVFCGGGTAGHVIPNIAIIENLKNNYEIYYIGSENGIEKNILKPYSYIKYLSVETTKLKRKLCFDNFLIPFKLFKGIKQAKKYLKEISPSVVFSKGGFVSLPTCIAANKLKIPVICHESDMSLGLANKIISKKALYMCCSFASTANSIPNGVYTGTPIKKEIFNGNKQKSIQKYKLNAKLPTLLIVGGSLGAKAINNVVFDCVKQLVKKYNVIHIVGRNNVCVINLNNYVQLDYVDNMGEVYACSDIILSRAGSNAINEMLALCKPMLLIPLPKSESRGDQIENAEYFKRCGYCEVLLQENLKRESLLEAIDSLYKNRQTYINKMKNCETKNATEVICDLIKKQK